MKIPLHLIMHSFINRVIYIIVTSVFLHRDTSLSINFNYYLHNLILSCPCNYYVPHGGFSFSWYDRSQCMKNMYWDLLVLRLSLQQFLAECDLFSLQITKILWCTRNVILAHFISNSHSAPPTPPIADAIWFADNINIYTCNSWSSLLS